LLCWDDSPHALYLLLGRKPGFRFLHVNQMREIGPDQDARLMAELCQVAPRVRWVAADLLYVCPPAPNPSDSLAEAGPDKLPRWPNAAWRANFPYYLPAVFRTGTGHGRYVLFALPSPSAIRECGHGP
jgi:hypothetical protein